MSYSFDFPDKDADKYEQEVMNRYGPGQYKTIKGRTEAGVAEWVHDYCVHGWEEVGITFRRRANCFDGICYCQMIKKIEEEKPEDEKPYYGSSPRLDGATEDWESCEVWSRVMGYHRPISSFNKSKKETIEKTLRKASKSKKTEA